MKNLKLNSLKLEVNDMLQREHLKTILGGGHGGYAQPRDACDPFGAGCIEGEVCCGAPGGPYECSYSACK